MRRIKAVKSTVTAAVATLLALAVVPVTAQPAAARPTRQRGHHVRIGREAGGEGRGIVDVPVSFDVRNLDRTALGPTELQTCPADPAQRGAEWTVTGHLVAPAESLREEQRSVTLYVHGVAMDGDTSFRFDGAPGYDYAAEEARAGHTSVVIDRVGYGPSSRPGGNDVCIGADADMVHQVVGHLRAGDYGGPGFQRVGLAGHSAGGLIAEIEAYTFGDIDALAVFGYADQGFTPFLLQELGRQAVRCQSAGNGYAVTFNDLDDPVSPADNTPAALLSPDADPRVARGVIRRHQPDPCGENPIPYIESDPAQLAQVTVPVLLVYGEDDALFDSTATAPVQASHFGSTDKTVVILPDTSHLMMLEPAAPLFRSRVAAWLDAHDL